VVDAGTGTGAGQHATVNGAIGPAVRVRSAATIGVAKVRRGADVCGVIDDGAVIGRGATVQCGATVSAGAVVRAGATINAGATVAAGAVVPRGTTVVSPAVTVVTAGASRTWSDGTTAASCEQYLHPVGAQVYSGSTGDGVYSISPTGGAPFDVWCDQTRDGGGWTLWASLVMGPSALTGTVLPSSAGYMDTTRYAALHTQATLFKARRSTTGLSYYLPAGEAAAGNCHSMATSVPENVDGVTYTTVYGHKETSGCTLTGTDYSWLSVGAGPGGSYNVISGSTPGVSMWHQDTAAGSLATRSSTEARVEMYVR